MGNNLCQSCPGQEKWKIYNNIWIQEFYSWSKLFLWIMLLTGEVCRAATLACQAFSQRNNLNVAGCSLNRCPSLYMRWERSISGILTGNTTWTRSCIDFSNIHRLFLFISNIFFLFQLIDENPAHALSNQNETEVLVLEYVNKRQFHFIQMCFKSWIQMEYWEI